jgi:hypothetical protein
MRTLILLAGTAALAIAAPAAAEKGGKGGSHGHGGQAAHAQHGGGHDARAAHGKGHAGPPQAARGQGPARHASKPPKVERQAIRRDVRSHDRLVRRVVDDRRPPVRVRGFRAGEPRFGSYDRGCPPGLAKKHNGCLPPGQAKKLFRVGDRVRRDWFGGYDGPRVYRSFYYDTPDYAYRYDYDGYIYRVDRRSELIIAVIPLFGGGFAVGQPLPAGYDVYNVPLRYRDTWYDDDDYLYRYGDNAIYRVDAGSGIIDGIVSLLTGDLDVGRPLPSGYDAYNLPLDYRDRYYDNDDYLYRYADGNIYQVDAKTQLIQAIVEMLV